MHGWIWDEVLHSVTVESRSRWIGSSCPSATEHVSRVERAVETLCCSRWCSVCRRAAIFVPSLLCITPRIYMGIRPLGDVVKVQVSLIGGRDVVGQIYQQLKAAILGGRLAPGQALPATRELADSLGVSRNSVLSAYSRLGEEGIVVSRVGAGSFVSSDVPRNSSDGRGQVRTCLQPKEFWGNVPELEYFDRSVADYDFRTGLPDVSLFPFTVWRRLVVQELRASSPHTAGYGDPAGHPRLRAAISRHTGVTRGVRSSLDNIIVTSGAQQALDLAARVFLEPGDCVVVEEPGYPPARLVFESHGARVISVGVDENGLDLTALPRTAKMIYLTPSHQYPMGMSMPTERRRAVLKWAERLNVIVIEDDYDCEYRYDGRPFETLQSLDQSGRVLYVGSFSKTILPSIRLGFIMAPSSLTSSIRRAKLLADGASPMAMQGALARFIDTGLLAAHIRGMRLEYAVRRDIIINTLVRDFSTWLTPLRPAAGLHLAAVSADLDLDTVRVVQKMASAAGVAISCLADYYCDSAGRPGLLFGYGTISTTKLEEGLRRLRRCFAEIPSGLAMPG